MIHFEDYMALFVNAVIGGIASILINYLADVLPISRKLTRPICLNCANPFTLREYLFSFRCSKCKSRTSMSVVWVSIFSILACCLLYFFPLNGLSFWATIPLLVFLGVILVIDIEYRVVLIQTSIAGLGLFFVYGLLMHNLWVTLAGGLAGFLIMLGLYYFGILFNKIMGRLRKQEIEEVALGFGDVYVCAFMGLFNGWTTIFATILIAILASGAFSLIYIVAKLITGRYRSFSAIPYTPFLITAGVAVYYIFR